MDEYISREETIKRIKECYCTGCNSYNGVRCRACGTGDAIDMIEDVPVADVAPVRHGRWVQVICHEEFEDGFVDRVKECCSVCHAPNWQRTTNYCPNCGAKMDGGVEDARL